MDLLGTILNQMQKPPEKSEKEKKLQREQKKEMEKLQEKNRKQKELFTADIEQRVDAFVKDSSLKRYKFEPMSKINRTVIYDICEVAGITVQAFGRDNIGERYVMLFKKDFPPKEAELAAYRRGENWDDDKELENIRQQQQQQHQQQQELVKKEEETLKQPVKPVCNYKEKYHHIIGVTAARDAARKTQANKCFGMVPSQNKRDQRSIEETLAAISAKRKKRDESTRNLKS